MIGHPPNYGFNKWKSLSVIVLWPVTLATVLPLVGCGSVEVQRGKNLATAGVQYSKSTAGLIDVANDAMIDSDSEALVRTKLPAAALNADMTAKLADRLKQLDSGLVDNTKMFISLHASLSATESYFLALQNLADNPQSEAAASAVSTLSDRVNSLNEALKKGDSSLKPVVSEQQKTAFAGLTKLVVDQVHGAKVNAALKRDAAIIGETLHLQGQIIDLAGPIISGALIDQNNRFYIDHVKRQFEKQEIGSTWVSDRNTYIKAKAIGETSKELKAAKQAATQMSASWEKILAGAYDTSEMTAQIAEVETLVAAIVKLKQAEKPKAADK